uniref:hypothetical protein n=1 Tax=Kitasatospora indigofera TaxID=67307 RepID=UPI002F9159F3
MSHTDAPLTPSPDTHYLLATAALYGWHVAQQTDRRMQVTRPGWTLILTFTALGKFRTGQARRPGTDAWEVGLQEAVSILERHGRPVLPA